jgi:hypothetical protein
MTTDRRVAEARSFGLLIAGALVLLGIAPVLRRHLVRPPLLIAAAVVLLLALAVPRSLVGPRRIWLAFGERLGRVTSPIVIGLVYVVAVVPMALVLRLRRRDPLGLRLDRARASYWVRRDGGGTDLTRQF